MQLTLSSELFPKPVCALLALYFVASLAHFTNNAEYIAYYPNMPAWITRETVYLAWLGITAVGVAGIVLSRLGWRFLGAVAILAYGLFGLDGLAHYTLALCSEHSWAMNLTIWAEAAAGLLLALCCAVWASRLFAANLKSSASRRRASAVPAAQSSASRPGAR